MIGALAALLVLASPLQEGGVEALAAVEAEQVALFERVAAGVVVISHGDTVGTGFAVAQGLFLTAEHVVLGAREVEVSARDGSVLRGEVVHGPGAEMDLALVRVRRSSVEPLELSDAARLRTGNVVAAVGHGDGNRWSFATGIVANAEADGPGGSLLRLQLPLRPGASGGPVVDRAGRVVGMITKGGPGVAFAVRATFLQRALEGLSALPPAEAGEGLVELSRSPETPLVAPRMIVAPADPRPLSGGARGERRQVADEERPTP